MATSTLPALAQDAAADRAESAAPQGSPSHRKCTTSPQTRTHSFKPAKEDLAGLFSPRHKAGNALILWCDSVWCAKLARTRIMSRRNHAECGARSFPSAHALPPPARAAHTQWCWSGNNSPTKASLIVIKTTVHVNSSIASSSSHRKNCGAFFD